MTSGFKTLKQERISNIFYLLTVENEFFDENKFWKVLINLLSICTVARDFFIQLYADVV